MNDITYTAVSRKDMSFEEFRNLFIKNFECIIKYAKPKNLYEVDIDKDDLWDLFLNSFDEKDNPVFRERRYFDCNLCKNFIKNFGNVVAIIDDEDGNYILRSVWNFSTGCDIYDKVLRKMSKYIKGKSIKSVYYSTYRQIGCKSNRQIKYKDKDVNLTFCHLYIELPNEFVIKRESTMNNRRSAFNSQALAFLHSLKELTIESCETVLDLIADNNLYRGKEYEFAVKKFVKLKKEFDGLKDDRQKEYFAWLNTGLVNESVCRIRNTAIGTLLEDLSRGVNTESAVRSFENMVSGTNYKRSKPIYTQKMLDDFKKTIIEMGYQDSLKRRFATYDDISTLNTMYLNKDANYLKVTVPENDFEDIFSSLEKNTVKKNKLDYLSSAKEISIDDFEKLLEGDFLSQVQHGNRDITGIELLVSNDLTKNFVSLITAENPDAKSMFKWNNPFSWAYTGNIADSLMKERVKELGGKVDGDVRFSISWNENGDDDSDLDAHCIEPSGHEIYYATDKKPYESPNHGQLDVDIMHPAHELNRGLAVENITYPEFNILNKGKYIFSVVCYEDRSTDEYGFKAELEVLGKTYYYEYNDTMRTGERVNVAELTVLEDGTYQVKNLLPCKDSTTRKVWNVGIDTFVPVTAIMLSPNYWDEENGTGNKHYFFMLKDCISDETPNGFYNEFLNNELYAHRKAAEALGAKCAVSKSDNQLSGLGFSSTMRNEIYLAVYSGKARLYYKVTF